MLGRYEGHTSVAPPAEREASGDRLEGVSESIFGFGFGLLLRRRRLFRASNFWVFSPRIGRTYLSIRSGLEAVGFV